VPNAGRLDASTVKVTIPEFAPPSKPELAAVTIPCISPAGGVSAACHL